MAALESAMVPAAEEPAESPGKRRRLNYEMLAEKTFPTSQLPADDDWPLPIKAVLRFAARLWAKGAGEVVGDFRSPLPKAGDRTQTVARCFQCDACEKFFQFTGQWKDDKSAFRLEVAQAGEHSGRPRKARKARCGEREECQVTVEERNRVLAAADALAARSVAITPSNVAVQMGRDRVAGPALVEILRNRKRKYGEKAEVFFCSAESFQEYADQMLGFVHNAVPPPHHKLFSHVTFLACYFLSTSRRPYQSIILG